MAIIVQKALSSLDDFAQDVDLVKLNLRLLKSLFKWSKLSMVYLSDYPAVTFSCFYWFLSFYPISLPEILLKSQFKILQRASKHQVVFLIQKS